MERRRLLRLAAAAGAAIVAGCGGDDPSTTTARGTEDPEQTGTQEPDAAVTVAVGADGSLRFEPDSFEISAGDAVRWTWEAGGHNVKPSSVPDGSSWSGTPGGQQETFEAGYDHVHTFETTGEYEYHCAPHQSAGMTGSFTVE